MKTHVVIGLGEILWDMLPEGKQLGGAPANFAFHAHALGATAYPVSAIGADALGRAMLEKLHHIGLSTQFVQLCGHPTGTVDVTVDPEGKPTYVIREDVAWDFIEWNEGMRELARRADAVCFGSLCQRSPESRATIARFLDDTRPECLRVFDINLRLAYFTREVVGESLARASVLKLNDEELPVVAELLGLAGGEEEVIDELIHRFSLQLVALTKGPRGSLLKSPAGSSAHPGVHVEVVDTVGSGDAFAAAVVVGRLHGDSLDEINAAANMLAARVCAAQGATPVLRLPFQLRNAKLSGVEVRS